MPRPRTGGAFDPQLEWLLFWACLVPLLYFTIAHFPVANTLLENDTLRSATLFTDAWRSLNHQGVFSWWGMDVQTGYPHSFNLFSVVSGKTLLFSLFSLIVTLLGWMGVVIEDFAKLFVFYIAFWIPLGLALSVFYLARQLFTDPIARLYAAIAAAFSPGALVGLTDLAMVEPGVFGLAFLAAWLRFLANGDAAAWRWLIFWCGTFIYAFSYPSLQGALLLVPIAAAWPLFSAPRRRRLWRALAGVRRADWILAGLVWGCAFWPSLTLLGEMARFERPLVGAMAFTDIFGGHLRPGNPFQLLFSGVPFGDLNWGASGHYLPQVDTRYISFGYLGLLSLPLMVLGLLYGRPALRAPLFVLAVLAPIVLLMNNGHPFTAALLSLPTPFQSNRHFSDLYFRVVGFLPLIFASALGVEALSRNRGNARRAAPWLAAASLLLASVILIYRHREPSIWVEMPTGFAVMVGGLLVVVLVMLKGARGRVSRGWMRLLLVMALADVAGFAFWHVNFQLIPANRASLIAYPFSGGSLSAYWANNHLTLRPVADLRRRGLDPGRLPWLDLYCAAHSDDEAGLEALNRAVVPGGERRSLALPAEDLARLAFQEIGVGGGRPEPGGASLIGVTRQEPDLLEARVNAPDHCALFWRDAWHPHWRAWVNGAPAPIGRALGAYKAVSVPPGLSTVRFEFSPTPWIRSLIAAHLGLILALILALVAGRDPARRRS